MIRIAGLVPILRPIERVSEVARVEKRRVRNAYDVMNVELGLATMVQRPTDMVPWIASECDAPERVRQRALELARLAEQEGLANGCRPSGVAAGCLYRAADEAGVWVTQGELADAAGVSAVTVRTHWEALEEALEG